MISIIVAINKNNGIGYKNELLYWLPNDLKRFKTLTTGHTIIMGRKTFESLPKGALPNRRNIVLSSQDITFPGAECFHSLEEALEACKEERKEAIIGFLESSEEAKEMIRLMRSINGKFIYHYTGSESGKCSDIIIEF